MNHDERIERMVAAGTLSRQQAESLKRSLAPPPAGAPTEEPTRLAAWLPALVVLLLAAALAALFVLGADADSTAAVQDVSQSLNDPGGIGKMNSTLSKSLAIALFLLFPIILFAWLYNGLASKEEAVHKAWAQVESNFQRRADLIPNLVETASKYMAFEAETLETVTAERGGGLKGTLEALVSAQQSGAALLRQAQGKATGDEAYMAALDAAQRRVGSLMHQLIATVENYPNLRAGDQMLQLQAQLEGTENRINVARMRFNESVAEYNSSMRRLPANLVASLGSFQRKAYFKAESDAEKGVDVDFR